VIDQSDGTQAEQALSRFVDPRLRYVRTDTRGVTLARNLGIERSDGDIVACTDDDCRVAPDWASTIAAIFDADPQVAVVCGRVRVHADVEGAGYTLGFEPRVREWQGHYPPADRDWGITANLALRRDILKRVGKFDPILGAGAPLISGGEPDFLYRVLRAGLKVINASEVVVDHFGVRAPGLETRKLIHGYMLGTGAAFWKHVRLGDAVALGVYLNFIATILRGIGINLLREKRPQGLGYLIAFLRGTVQSYRFRVDRNLRQYIPR
jgi:glycosyltransferase involved in cell wall biosynthesis